MSAMCINNRGLLGCCCRKDAHNANITSRLEDEQNAVAQLQKRLKELQVQISLSSLRYVGISHSVIRCGLEPYSFFVKWHCFSYNLFNTRYICNSNEPVVTYSNAYLPAFINLLFDESSKTRPLIC